MRVCIWNIERYSKRTGPLAHNVYAEFYTRTTPKKEILHLCLKRLNSNCKIIFPLGKMPSQHAPCQILRILHALRIASRSSKSQRVGQPVQCFLTHQSFCIKTCFYFDCILNEDYTIGPLGTIPISRHHRSTVHLWLSPVLGHPMPLFITHQLLIFGHTMSADPDSEKELSRLIPSLSIWPLALQVTTLQCMIIV